MQFLIFDIGCPLLEPCKKLVSSEQVGKNSAIGCCGRFGNQKLELVSIAQSVILLDVGTDLRNLGADLLPRSGQHLRIGPAWIPMENNEIQRISGPLERVRNGSQDILVPARDPG